MTKRKKKTKSNFETSNVAPVGTRVSQYEGCPLCSSSDAMAIYEKDDPVTHFQSWCFSCKGIQTAWTEMELHDVVDQADAPDFRNMKNQLVNNSKPKEREAPMQEEAQTNKQEVELDFDYRDIKDWGISKEVCQEVGIGVKIVDHGSYIQRKIYQNYKNEAGQITAQKVRIQNLNAVLSSAGEPELDSSGRRVWETTSNGQAKWDYIKTNKGKEIKCTWYGNVADAELFGMDRARRMSSKKIVIVEGEKDLAAFVSVFTHFAVVSVKDGASGVAKDCKKHFQFLNAYDEIYVIGDNDEAGKQMNKDVASLFPRKHKVVHLDKFNDIQEYTINGAVEELKTCFFNAKKQVPQMVKPISELMPLLFEPDPPCYCDYPWPSFNDKLGGIHLGEVVGILAHEKVGKCHGKNTPIRMADYSIKLVQDIVEGDLVMGTDGAPRKVRGVVSGIDNMYRVDQSRGMSYTVNSVHLVATKRTARKGSPIEFVEAKDLAQKTYQQLKGDFKGFRVAFAPTINNPVLLDPYILGAWLGDGTEAKPQITNTDPEIISAFKDYAELSGLKIAVNKTGITYDITRGESKVNHFTADLRNVGVLGCKHIPSAYIYNSKEVGLAVLAGLLDTDGYLQHRSSTFEITQKSDRLAADIIELANLHGFTTTHKKVTKSCAYLGEKREGQYNRITISGDFSEVPLRVKHKRIVRDRKMKFDYRTSSLKITPIGVDTYYGFELEGEDKCYLLADGTVTHNTSFLRNVAHNVWKTTGDPVGIIFLEDIKKDLVKGMVSLQLGVNLSKKGVVVPNELLQQAANELMEDDRIYFKAEGGPGETGALMDVIDWMIAVGCKVIFFDNVSTLIVGDTASDSERQGIDNLIVECRDRATASEVCIFVVQHLNRQGTPRGSHALPIFASTTLELIRDGDAEDDVAKNTTEVVCRGNRKFGFRGEVALLNYEHDTSYLTELNQNSIMAYKEWKERVKEESKKRRD